MPQFFQSTEDNHIPTFEYPELHLSATEESGKPVMYESLKTDPVCQLSLLIFYGNSLNIEHSRLVKVPVDSQKEHMPLQVHYFNLLFLVDYISGIRKPSCLRPMCDGPMVPRVWLGHSTGAELHLHKTASGEVS